MKGSMRITNSPLASYGGLGRTGSPSLLHPFRGEGLSGGLMDSDQGNEVIVGPRAAQVGVILPVWVGR
jgi:hypothetical protein